MTIPYVSIVVTAFKERPYILAALESAINQTVTPELYEIILVTNYVNSELLDYVEQKNIRMIQISDASQGIKIIEALKSSKGEVISFLEDDDLFYNNKIAIIMQIFRENPHLCYYHNMVTFIDARDNIILPPPLLRRHIENMDSIASVLLRNPNEIKKEAHRNRVNFAFNLSSISVRREMLEEYSDLIRSSPLGMDVLLYIISVVYGGQILADNKKLSYFRFHDKNSSLKSKMSTSDKLRHMEHILLTNLNTRKIALDASKMTKEEQIIRPRANYYYLSKILYMIFKGDAKRSIIAIYLLKYLQNSSFTTIMTRADVLFYSIVDLFSPKLATSFFLKRYLN